MIDIKNEMLGDYETYGPQFTNLWEFYIDDWNDYGHISKLKVLSTSIPFITFEQGKRHTGHHHYTGYNFPESITVSFKEDTNFSVSKYFEAWRDRIFDTRKGVFKSGVEQTKTAYVSFYSFRFVPGALQRLQNEVVSGAENLLIQERESALSRLENTSSDLQSEKNRKSLVYDQIYENQKKVLEYSEQPSNESYLEEVETRMYTIYGLRYLSMSSISLSYEGSDQLKLDVTLGLDFIEEEKEANL